MKPQSQTQTAIQELKDFVSIPIAQKLTKHLQTDTTTIAISLFQDIVATVPAYQDFLKQQKINPQAIQTLEQFQALPTINKENYISRYSLAQLCIHGKLENCDMIAASSGSTGKPTFWPRFLTDEMQIATRFEQIFHDSFHADSKRTLAVVCFTLGTWVGGMFTTNCCRHLALKGYPITVITPGNNKTEILRIVQEIGDNFEQIVLLGYPPFLKDVIDTGIADGMQWSQYQIKLVMAGEVFSEEWRNLVAERIGSQNPCYDFASMYGTADAGVLGNETPLSICIRRFLSANPTAAKALFGESRLPTLVQYDPCSRFFEEQGGNLLFSGKNGIPLIRYNILDHGGLISYEQMLKFLDSWGFNPLTELQSNTEVYQLPFVYIFGRSNFTVSYFGANIYPENISVGLEQPTIREWVTGKFVLQVKEDYDKNRFLSVVVELAPGVDSSEEKQAEITASILSQLLRLNSEFANYVPLEYQSPQLELKPTGDIEYFPVGVKHRYTRK
ncbi:phenylacetate--CoA ligase family protein [Sphaerospermopsis aphanizomenoides BCCUSP55]|uniref:phenylacetate--CoA ligase family protein n=1 Tax=Sphaerospermopsis aphanizomenoides TaxID=459663 RepID=UPI001904BC11|nr:phenylacetate--CoA ligase family protein [Sphaerospermopsis aphanizomenoides]MBK1987222.1 phenylacetate--CoA ligase family protein [Sphaerospermopsis aphanizomenoides BCCUSP55]